MTLFRSNKETLAWAKGIKWRDMTQENLTKEADSFFGVVKTTRLRTVQAKIAEFVTREHRMRQTLSFQIMRAHNGEGPRGRNPPLTFRLKDVTLNGFISVINGERESEVKCEICGTPLLGKDNCEKHLRAEHFKQFKSLFAKECSSETENHVTYKKWEADQTFIDGLTFFSEEDRVKYALEQTENKKVESQEMPESGETFKVVREKSSGRNIFEAERSVFTLNQEGGEQKKAVIKDVYAKITTRKRANEGSYGDTNAKKHKMSSRGLRYHATNVNNILEHVSAHDKETQAVLVAKVVDQNGPEFAKDVLKNSKEIQNDLKMTPFETASMQAGLGIPDNGGIKMRTAMNKAKGWNMLASHKKVKAIREETLPFGKEAWDFQSHNLYKNKQGNNKKMQTKTKVAIVKDLHSYIQLHANMEGNMLKDQDELPLVLGGDAGGGRFVAEFSFLSRKDKSLKLHPITLYEGTDCRENLQKTIGQLTPQIRDLEGKKLIINEKEVRLKIFCLLDLCALNNALGKQNHSATYPDTWTNVKKEHLSFEAHKGKPHTPNDCKDIKFVSLADFDQSFAHHAVHTGKTSDMNKTGREFYSVVNQNLIPLEDMFRFVPPLLHIVMGLGKYSTLNHSANPLSPPPN